MTTTIRPPTTYRHWTGRPARVRRADELDGRWRNPTIVFDGVDSTVKVPRHGSSGWKWLGWAPRPQTRWRRFWHHWHHGRLMGYPRLSVAVFCLRGLFFDHQEPTR